MKKALCVMAIFICFCVCVAGCSNTSKLPAANGDFSNESQTVSVNMGTETGGQEILKKSDNTKTADALIKNTYSISEVFGNQHFGLYFSYQGHSGYFETLQSVDEICKIECLRDMGNGKYYAVFKIQEGGRVFSFFQHESNGEVYLSHSIYVAQPLDKTKVKELKKGDSFSTMMEADPSISRCFHEGTLCNCIVPGDTTYTVHLFKDELYLIRWEQENANDENPDNIFIDSIEIFPNRKLRIDQNTMSDGVYDYTILPQDYPK